MSYSQIEKKMSPSSGADYNFGTSVVIDGYFAAVGEPSNTKTYLYKRSINGTWESMIPGGISMRGNSLAMYGDYLVVGDTVSREVKIYNKNTTADNPLQTKAEASIPGFGGSVAISENYLIIGASESDSNKGSVYIYKKTATDIWGAYSGNPITLTASEENGYFGCSVTTNDTSIIVGAKGDNQKTGAVYVYIKNTDTNLWELTQTILASDGAINDEFGVSVSASGNYFVVGARYKDSSSGDINSGAAYVYKYTTTWYEVDKLSGIDENNPAGDHFGESVYINGDYIIIGSPAARNIGVADVFYKKRGWGHLKKITGGDSSSEDNFGNAVSISGRFLIVGGAYNDEAASNAGAVYLYDDPPVRLRLAQEFDVNAEYLPSKATVYLKRVGKNNSDYWGIYNTTKTVIDATNFLTITSKDNIVIFSDELDDFTGNGYMILKDSSFSNFSVINYPIRAIQSDTYNLWIRCLSSNSERFKADILIDGEISKTIDQVVNNPSIPEWAWVNTTIVLPDTREHVLGIRIKEDEAAIDKLYIEADSTIPYGEGPDYIISPYLTIHMQVYNSGEAPVSSLYMYDYKNTITQVVQDDWYNFDIRVLDDNHGYTSMSDFEGSYYLVMSSSGSTHDNFVVWELVDNDEYNISPSAIKF